MLLIIRPLFQNTTKRYYATTASKVYSNSSNQPHVAVNTTPQDLSPHHRHFLDSALRVDQAGELAANAIYKGQMTILGRDPEIRPLIQARLWHPNVLKSSRP